MEISQHYSSYPKPTLIVITNNELARVCKASDRTIDEIARIEVPLEKPNQRATGSTNSAPPDLDAMKEHNQMELYKSLSELLLKELKNDIDQILFCAPEIHKNTLLNAMHTDVQKAVKEVVPKNLASLPLDQIVRILNEHRG